METVIILLNGLLLGAVSYFLVWTLHHASIFENLIMWAETSDTFIKRIISCPICVTYHMSLFAVSIPAFLLVWDPATWFITWCLSCCISLSFYSRKLIQPFDD